MPAGAAGDATDFLGRAGHESLPVQLPLSRAGFGGGEIHHAQFFINAGQRVHLPVAGSQPANNVAVQVIQVQMTPAVALGRPDKGRNVVQEVQVVVQVDPGVAGFGQNGAGFAAVAIGKNQLERFLVAALALEGQLPAVGQPGHARNVDVVFIAQVNPGDPAAFQRNNAQPVLDVGGANKGVALFNNGDFVGFDFMALRQLNVGFVDWQKGQMAAVGRPPEAPVATHFLLGNEFGDAVGNGVGGAVGQRGFLAGFGVDHPQVPAANKSDVLSVGGHPGVGIKFRRVGELPDLPAFGCQVKQEQVAADREQHKSPVTRPSVANNAAQVGNAFAFATGLFVIGQLNVTRGNFIGGRQAAQFVIGDVVFPQLEQAGVILAGLQKGDPVTGGRQLGLAQGRTGKVRARKYALKRQFGRAGCMCARCMGEKRDGKHNQCSTCWHDGSGLQGDNNPLIVGRTEAQGKSGFET